MFQYIRSLFNRLPTLDEMAGAIAPSSHGRVAELQRGADDLFAQLFLLKRDMEAIRARLDAIDRQLAR